MMGCSSGSLLPQEPHITADPAHEKVCRSLDADSASHVLQMALKVAAGCVPPLSPLPRLHFLPSSRAASSISVEPVEAVYHPAQQAGHTDNMTGQAVCQPCCRTGTERQIQSSLTENSCGELLV